MLTNEHLDMIQAEQNLSKRLEIFENIFIENIKTNENNLTKIKFWELWLSTIESFTGKSYDHEHDSLNHIKNKINEIGINDNDLFKQTTKTIINEMAICWRKTLDVKLGLESTNRLKILKDYEKLFRKFYKLSDDIQHIDIENEQSYFQYAEILVKMRNKKRYLNRAIKIYNKIIDLYAGRNEQNAINRVKWVRISLASALRKTNIQENIAEAMVIYRNVIAEPIDNEQKMYASYRLALLNVKSNPSGINTYKNYFEPLQKNEYNIYGYCLTIYSYLTSGGFINEEPRQNLLNEAYSLLDNFAGTNRWICYLKGEFLLYENRFDEAAQNIRNFSDYNNDQYLLFILFKALFKGKKWSDLIQLFEENPEQEYNIFEISNYVYDAYREQGKVYDAFLILERLEDFLQDEDDLEEHLDKIIEAKSFQNIAEKTDFVELYKRDGNFSSIIDDIFTTPHKIKTGLITSKIQVIKNLIKLENKKYYASSNMINHCTRKLDQEKNISKLPCLYLERGQYYWINADIEYRLKKEPFFSYDKLDSWKNAENDFLKYHDLINDDKSKETLLHFYVRTNCFSKAIKLYLDKNNEPEPENLSCHINFFKVDNNLKKLTQNSRWYHGYYIVDCNIPSSFCNKADHRCQRAESFCSIAHFIKTHPLRAGILMNVLSDNRQRLLSGLHRDLKTIPKDDVFHAVLEKFKDYDGQNDLSFSPDGTTFVPKTPVNSNNRLPYSFTEYLRREREERINGR